MRTSKNSNHKNRIDSISSESNICIGKRVFLNECVFRKTEDEEHDLIFISIPKKLRGIIFPNSSELVTIGQNQTNELFSIIKHFLFQKKFVEKILFLKKGDVLHIWTAISGYNEEENRKSLYKNESDLMNFLKKADFHFDFHLIDLEQVEDTLSCGASVIFEKRN